MFAAFVIFAIILTTMAGCASNPPQQPEAEKEAQVEEVVEPDRDIDDFVGFSVVQASPPPLSLFLRYSLAITPECAPQET